MIERLTTLWLHIPTRDRQMLAAAYWPVIVFAAVEVVGRISRLGRPQLPAGLR